MTTLFRVGDRVKCIAKAHGSVDFGVIGVIVNISGSSTCWVVWERTKCATREYDVSGVPMYFHAVEKLPTMTATDPSRAKRKLSL